MAGLCAMQGRVRFAAENFFCCTALWCAGGRAMGKFFLIIIAISVAVLLAMSAYVISL
jgi:formate/nitrite transporter FocA (FNT family)